MNKKKYILFLFKYKFIKINFINIKTWQSLLYYLKKSNKLKKYLLYLIMRKKENFPFIK